MSESAIVDGPIGFIFPGQGSQFVGMTRELVAASAAAREVVAEADAILGAPLSTLMIEGPADILEDTYNAQSAILVASVAALAAVQERLAAAGRTISPAMVAGHSLGEFTALVAAGSLDFADALRLVRERGRLMKEAGQKAPGGMAAMLGIDDAALAEVCAEAADLGIVVLANANCPGQTVISGEVAALEKAMELAKGRGAKRAARLGVSIASHSPLMAPANAEFQLAVASATIRDPRVPVVSNVTAQPLRTAADVRGELAIQMERAVQWTGTIQTMRAAGIASFIELGPGAVLSGLVKRIDREAACRSIADLGLDLPLDKPA